MAPEHQTSEIPPVHPSHDVFGVVSFEESMNISPGERDRLQGFMHTCHRLTEWASYAKKLPEQDGIAEYDAFADDARGVIRIIDDALGLVVIDAISKKSIEHATGDDIDTIAKKAHIYFKTGEELDAWRRLPWHESIDELGEKIVATIEDRFATFHSRPVEDASSAPGKHFSRPEAIDFFHKLSGPVLHDYRTLLGMIITTHGVIREDESLYGVYIDIVNNTIQKIPVYYESSKQLLSAEPGPIEALSVVNTIASWMEKLNDEEARYSGIPEHWQFPIEIVNNVPAGVYAEYAEEVADSLGMNIFGNITEIIAEAVSEESLVDPANFHIRLEAVVEEGQLAVRVYNTGKYPANFRYFKLGSSGWDPKKRRVQAGSGTAMATHAMLAEALRGSLEPSNTDVDGVEYATTTLKLPILPR